MKARDEIANARRKFLRAISAVAGAELFGKPALSQIAAPREENSSAYQPQALQENELAVLKAVMSRLIPADESGGGAFEARAFVYVDRALAGANAKHLPAYRAGLGAIQAWALARGARTIGQVAAADLDALLVRLQAGTADQTAGSDRKTVNLPDGGRAFFALLLQHTLEGTFCDPMHGGNHNFIGWRLLGYPGVQLTYSEAQQAINQRDGRANRSAAAFGGGVL